MTSDPRTTWSRRIPDDVVAFIKAVYNQDKREREAAGFRYASQGLSKRIAAMLGLNIHTVLAIHENRRHRHQWAHRNKFRAITVPLERLAVLRRYREQCGRNAPWSAPKQPKSLRRRKRKNRSGGRPPRA